MVLAFKSAEYADGHGFRLWWVLLIFCVCLSLWFALHGIQLLESFDRRSEDILVLPIVITELELGNIERHVFSAHFVERADHAALEDRPKSLDGLSMDGADDILASRMVNGRVWVVRVERIVAWVLIGAKQTDPVRHRFADEGGESGRIHICNHARNHIALTANSTNDWPFRRRKFHQLRRYPQVAQYPP